ncbi:trophoblast glycoprotein-like [Glandiceps talaboti]
METSGISHKAFFTTLCRSPLLLILVTFVCLISQVMTQNECPQGCLCYSSSSHAVRFEVTCDGVGFPHNIPTFTTSLTIRNNPVNWTLPENPFGTLPDLEKLDLTNNSITSVEVKTFHGSYLPVLKELILDKNDLTFEHSKMLNGLDNLRNLSLKSAIFNASSIGYVSHAFSRSNLMKLTNLWLDSNELVVLPRNTFIFDNGSEGAQHLQMISLRNNSIGVIYPGTFDYSNLQNLETLDLSDNGLTKLEETELNDFDNFPNLTIKLRGNFFVCNCDLKYFSKWLVKTNVTVTDKNQLTCAEGFYPEQNAHKMILELAAEDLKCKHVPSVGHYVEPSYVILSLILSFLIACFLGVVFLRRRQIKAACTTVVRAARDSLENGPYGNHHGYTDINKHDGRDSPEPPEVHL